MKPVYPIIFPRNTEVATGLVIEKVGLRVDHHVATATLDVWVLDVWEAVDPTREVNEERTPSV